MTRKPLPDESAQCADVYFDTLNRSQKAVRDGYDQHAVADALLEVARDILADNYEFMTVFERFRKRRNIDPS